MAYLSKKVHLVKELLTPMDTLMMANKIIAVGLVFSIVST